MNWQKRVVCPENEGLVTFIMQKRQEMTETPRGLSENIERSLNKAYSNVCLSKVPITTLKDLSQVKGVGKWILGIMKGFFASDCEMSDLDGKGKGKKTKGTRRYIPQKQSVAYALLLTLYRETTKGRDFMHKQELIDAAEASGFSRAPIRPELGKGKPGQMGRSPREWYSGWSCMKTLIDKGLVVKSSNPAKFMLSPEGQEVASECLSRSGLAESSVNLSTTEILNVDLSNVSEPELVCADSPVKVVKTNSGPRRHNKTNVPDEFLEKFGPMGFSKEQISRAFSEVMETSGKAELSSLWPAVLCCLKQEQVYGVPPMDKIMVDAGQVGGAAKKNTHPESSFCVPSQNIMSACSTDAPFTLRACSTSSPSLHDPNTVALVDNMNYLSIPPLRVGENFDDAYEVILILDDREKFAGPGSKHSSSIARIKTEFGIEIKVARLPVGDAIWVARHKRRKDEYILDFIVERKNVEDLRSSIRDNRYRDQKLRLLRCGLKKVIYVVEGDPNASEASDSIKTACFTTEISEGFDVQRTSGLGETLRKYGHLTRAIAEYYKRKLPDEHKTSSGVCPLYSEFIKRCHNLDKMTVSDLFGVQLMQIPQVTEEVAIAVLDLYPTVVSIARAYELIDGDLAGQEDMLRRQSNGAIGSTASRNIFRLIWGS
ncbi:crossover junction endonuclease MUS81 [Impatiens glandulifera]|uniref:crossover junction endonuclease MUS81 n=1 Tax=Impatiens glandulifera TaxID=253017 RepID=UPI001FB08B99|nr:crossover junction endonuclease MUS81 [Impatiens glandulifera]